MNRADRRRLKHLRSYTVEGGNVYARLTVGPSVIGGHLRVHKAPSKRARHRTAVLLART